MAGILAASQLTVPAAHDRVRFAIATSADDAAMRRLLRENPMRGSISLSFEREPGYFRGAGIAGAIDDTILAFERDRLICMGRCTTRACWLDGEIRRVGYLAELRLDASAQGRVEVLRRGYQFFGEQHRHAPADFYFTSIASDNHRARRLLESGARGLPCYTFLAEFVTLAIPVPLHPRPGALRCQPATPERLADLVALLNAHPARHQLAPAWSEESLLSLARHGLPLDHFQLALEGDRIVACAALWDQRSFRQTVIRGYTPALSLARPAVNFAARVLGTPRLPAPGSALAHASLSPLAFTPGAEALLPDLVETFFPHAAQRGLEFITLGLAARDPRLPLAQRRFRCRTYRSRLYQVSWPGDRSTRPFAGGRLFFPEVALL